ncbi:META domain-containing protein [Qipengyuania sp. 6B39]|uniref:META domain-containing protein n=1 Tax=Qipengyuania proteolytica TaxID=2867239 RepID=UPI001C89177B|nr:META domain-containing protein [Qipengyuania proteolytica]MBX7496711.1 META domain-containing protein [Qipengyuania proteolytica]
MTRTLTAALALALGATALAGCESILDQDRGPLSGTSWKLATMVTMGNRTTLAPAASDRHRITFNRDGSLQLQLDCNNGRSSWSQQETGPMEGTLTIGDIASTRAFCPPPSFGQDMANDLPTARSYRIVPATDRLRIETRRTEYVFDRL